MSDRDGAGTAAAGLEESRRFLQRESSGDLVRGMVGAHASFTLSDETLASCVSLAERFDTGVHIHVAEDAADERDALARFGRRVVHRLADAGALTERALLAHGVHLDGREIELVRERGAWIAHNPRSNMHNRVGRAPVVDLGECVTLGTDGIDGDVFAESRAAYWRGREADPRVTPGWVLARLAASARFAGERFGEPRLGRVEPGAPADLVVLEYDPPTPFTAETLGGHWVFGFSARAVRDVVVNGSVVVRDRCLVRMDERELRARSRELAERLWAGVEAQPPHPFEPAGGA